MLAPMRPRPIIPSCIAHFNSRNPQVRQRAGFNAVTALCSNTPGRGDHLVNSFHYMGVMNLLISLGRSANPDSRMDRSAHCEVIH
jgi:hypothetical protein